MEVPNRSEMAALLNERANAVIYAVTNDAEARTTSNAQLLAEIANLGDQLRAGEVSASAWEDHELSWQAYVARAREAMVATTAKVIMAFEAMAKHEPEKITPEIAEKLRWWQNGGREEWLGELPLERRRALEEEASTLPRRDEM